MSDGGWLVARALKREGVEVIFTLCGGHVAPIYEGCLEEGIRILDVRHEQAAAHAADAWARLTRRVGVAVVTAGPGVTDSVTGVVNAYHADSPLLVIGGQAPIAEYERGALQEMNHVELMRPITKWSRSIPGTERIPEYLSMAFRHALSDRPGPVFLEIPVDLLLNRVEEPSVVFPEKYRTEARPQGDAAYVGQALALLESAERPVVIAGSAIWWTDAADALRAFAERAQLPVFLNAIGRGCLPPNHPLFFTLSRKYALTGADVILVIGAPLDFRLNYGKPPLFSPGAKVIQVDVDGASIGRNRPIEVGIVGDARAVLKQLADGLSPNAGRSARAWVTELRKQELQEEENLKPALNSDAVPIHPLRMIRALEEVIDADTVVIGDGGNIVASAAKVIHPAKPGHWLDPGRFGCLGVGIPFALAAKLARPQSKVLVINGDGAFGFNGMEFDTAVRHHLPIVSVIGNDAAWGQIRGPQIHFLGEARAVATSLALTRYDLMVEALGGHGEFVTRPEQLRPALERAFACGQPACVNVVIDPKANAEVSAATRACPARVI